MRKLIGIVLFLAIGSLVFDAYAQTRKSYVIGALIPFQTVEGIDMRRGIELAQEEVNAAWGKLGQRLNVIFEPTGGAVTELTVEKLVQQYKAPLVLGGYSSGVSEAALSYLKYHKIFQIPIGSAYPIFNMMDLGEMGRQLANFAIKDSGAQTVGILTVGNAIGTEIENSIKKALGEAGRKIVSEVRYVVNKGKYLENLESLFKYRPQIVFFIPIGVETKEILEQASEIGFKTKIGWYSTYVDLWEKYVIPETLEGIKGFKVGVKELLYENYTYKYTKIFNEKPKTVLGPFAYDATKLAALTLNQAKSTKYDDLIGTWISVADAYEGITGDKKFDKDGRRILKKYETVIYEKGRLVSYSPCPVPPLCSKQIVY